MSRRYFGTDGIRGTVGESPITPEFALRLGYAAGKVLAHQASSEKSVSRPVVLIGKDTRVSGYMLEAALECGFSAAGVDVMLAGPMPTPAVAYLTRALRLSVGVVISASHNPYQDNGIKFFSSQGDKLPDEVEAEIERELENPMGCESSDHLGKAKRLDDARGRYIEFCKSTFPAELDLRGMKIVVDCAHGAAYQVAPEVFHELGAEVIAIGNQPNGFNINDGYGATAPDNLILAVRANNAQIGLALDGDADRLLIVDAAGRLYTGDELLYVLIKDRLLAGQKMAGVVGTLMTNMAVELAIKKLGVQFLRAKVGDRYILELLREKQKTEAGWILGGEGSGHLLVLDKHTTGDGTISALQVLSAISRSQQSLAELTQEVNLFPQKLINVRIQPGYNWQANDYLQNEIRAVEQELGDTGRVLIRASGTEPVLRVMVEAADANLAQKTAERLAKAIQ